MDILAIDTSCDETSVAVTDGMRILTHIEYSQIKTHEQWGGVVPSLAKRAHQDKIEHAIEIILHRYRKYRKSESAQVSAVAVTCGPGLAIALEVGIHAAQAHAKKYDLPLIPVNHLEGHIYSCFATNRAGNPHRSVKFPFLALIVSGGHTELVRVDDYLTFSILGKTRDDAAGEALDKAARILGLGYPGASALEQIALQVQNRDILSFPRAMLRSHDLDFSFSGLKTSFWYAVETLSIREKKRQFADLASSYQEAVFDSIVRKTNKALERTGIAHLVCAGGVIANRRLRYLLRKNARARNVGIYFPPFPYLTGDNAAMIGIAGFIRKNAGKVADSHFRIERMPRLSLENSIPLK